MKVALFPVRNEEVDVPARVRDWATMHGIPEHTAGVALSFRHDHAPFLIFEQMRELTGLLWAEFDKGYTLGYYDAGAGARGNADLPELPARHRAAERSVADEGG